MQRIADWLEKLGMSEYVQRFVDNAIDLSVLPVRRVLGSSLPTVAPGDRGSASFSLS
jgi:hypothetical protein